MHRRQGNCIHVHLVPLWVTSPTCIFYCSEANCWRIHIYKPSQKQDTHFLKLMIYYFILLTLHLKTKRQGSIHVYLVPLRVTSPICIIYYSEANCWRIHMYISLHWGTIPTSWNWWVIKHFMLRLEVREQYTCSLCPFMNDLSHMHNNTLFWGQLLKNPYYMYISLHPLLEIHDLLNTSC